MRRVIIASSLMLLVASLIPNAVAHGAALPGKINLVVGDRIGAARRCEVVCSGVPFAKGALRPDQPMRAETAEGTPLPTQTKVLGRWPDESVKWLLVQFPADCPAKQTRTYHLVPGQAPSPKRPLVIQDKPDQVAVNTGPLRVTVPKTNLTVLGDVRLKQDGRDIQVLAGGTQMRFVLSDGTVHTSAGAKPEAVTVEEAGPIRTTVRVIGWLVGPGSKQLYKLDTRLRFYAGQSCVRADYTFICLGQPRVHPVKEIALDLSPSVGEAARYVLPGDTQPTRGNLAAGQTALLSVDAEMICRVGLDGLAQKARGRLDGWAVLSGQDAAVGVAVRDFRQLCPKAIEMSADRVRIALWSARAGKVLNLGRTRAKTHQVLFDFGSGHGDEGARLDRVRAFQNPLIATTDPEYLCTTDALGPLSPDGARETAEYDKKMRQCFETLRRQRETMPRENTMLHYGDYYHGGYGNELTRGNLEYDTGHACFLLYARSGQRDYYDFAVACNQHFIDMDINQETGDQRFHGYSDYVETHEAPTTTMEWGHVFVDCAADAYYLTGDERSLTALQMNADRVATIADGQGYEKIRNILAGAERQLGWPLLALCRAYEVTQDAKYLEAATKVVDYIKIYAKDPLAAYKDGKWWRSWMMDGCKVFMTGTLHEGLSAYYDITHDEELRAVIVKSLNWLIDHMWNPEMDGFVYEFNAMNRGHRRTGIAGLNMLAVDAFTFGYQMTGDRRYLAVGTRAFWQRTKEMTPEIDAKQFSIDARTSPHVAAYFYREHITPDRLPPSPKPIVQKRIPSPTGPRPEVLLRAGFEGDLSCQTPAGRKTGQAVGKIAFVPGRKGKAVAVGKGGYAWVPAPPDMLRRSGSIEMWVRLHFKKRAKTPGQRAVFHVEGASPLIDSLGAITIYSELRIRMKDHVGHLHGTAEGDIMAWQPNEWHHVVVTWDHKRVKLYLDGKEQTRPNEGKQAGDVANLPASGQTRINLGWRFGNWYCDCAIDELTVHGRALTGAEVAERHAR